jgi:hypothetical protein
MKTYPIRSGLMTACCYLWLCAAPAAAESPVQGPDTLFLTWFGDPTTSIVAQWLEEGEPLPIVEGATDDIPAFDMPKLDGITIDGSADDWHGRGLDAGFLAGDDGRVDAEEDLSASAQIAWDDRGLLVMLRVRDNVADEAEDIESLWSADSVELFVSTGVGSDQRYQVLVAPGADTKQAQARGWHYDYRSDRKSGDPTYEYACATEEGGYAIEVLLPWANLGPVPAAGERIGFQFYINDRDGEKEVKTIRWHPDHDANERPESMYALRLADEAGDGAVARAKVVREGDKAQLAVWADETLAGLKVQATCAGQMIGEGVLEKINGSATVSIGLADAPQGTRWGTIYAELDRVAVAYAKPLKWMNVSPPGPVKVVCESRTHAAFRGTYKPDEGTNTQVKPFGDYTGLFLHRAEFKELTPDETYELRVGGAEGASVAFRTAPATLNEPLVFAEGGDVGIWKNVPPLHTIAAGWGPRFGLIGGDCAYANGRTPENWVAYLRLWRKHMVDDEGRLIPMLCAIGNHEVDGSFGQPISRAPFFNALFDGLFKGKTYAALDFGDYLSLVLLDSGHVSAHDGAQARWLDKALAKRENRPHLFTAYHVPAYPSHREFEGKYSERARQHWVPLFEKHGVDVSFEHHDHTYKRTHVMTGGVPDPKGVLYLGDGCWGMSPRTVATPEERPYLVKSVSAAHVIRVTLDGNERRFIAVDVEGNQIDQYPE